MGWWTGYQMGPSFFFILCEYIDYVYYICESIFDLATTMSLRGPVLTLTARREAPSLMGRVGRVDGWDGWTGGRMGRVGRVGRSRKVSFEFLHTLWVYRLCIFLLVY